MDDADQGFTVLQHGDERCVKRHTMDVRLCAVDRVQYPLEIGFTRLFAKFLAENGVAWKSFANSLAEQFFGRAVGDGDGRVVRFAFDDQVAAAEIAERDFTGLAGNIHGELESFGGFRHSRRSC